MGQDSAIEWTDHTFNPWIGCQKVSPACDHCYAETMVNGRMAGNFAERRRTAPSNWKQPLAWNRKAEREGRRARVFCASLADVFDKSRGVLEDWRIELWRLIRATPHLDWLLPRTVVLPSLTAATAATKLRSQGFCSGALQEAPGRRSGETLRTWRGNLTSAGVTRLAKLQEGDPSWT